MRSLLLPGPYASCTKTLYSGPPGVVEASQRSSGDGAVAAPAVRHVAEAGPPDWLARRTRLALVLARRGHVEEAAPVEILGVGEIAGREGVGKAAVKQEEERAQVPRHDFFCAEERRNAAVPSARWTFARAESGVWW